ncbi:MAG: hypothetical protein JO121_04780 [Deltaproteobacteria bacterium]|nr:hypothetical protein [Deltaproteobacteria bacterium]
MKRAKEKERVAALSAGLAIVVLVWLAGGAFASEWFVSLGPLSIWFYGPIFAAAWGVLSLVSYTIIVRAQRRNPALCPEHEEATREARLARCAALAKVPKCVEQVNVVEKDKLAALMAGFAITIALWLALFSFVPMNWLESISVSPWLYSLASIAVWASSAHLMYWGFRRKRPQHSSIPAH